MLSDSMSSYVCIVQFFGKISQLRRCRIFLIVIRRESKATKRSTSTYRHGQSYRRGGVNGNRDSRGSDIHISSVSLRCCLRYMLSKNCHPLTEICRWTSFVMSRTMSGKRRRGGKIPLSSSVRQQYDGGLVISGSSETTNCSCPFKLPISTLEICARSSTILGAGFLSR